MDGNTVIRKAVPEDIDSVEQGYIELLTYEKEHGAYTKWRLGVYPTRKTAQTSYEDGTLHVLERDGEICASVILNRLQPQEYNAIEWKYASKPQEVLVIHTLCVRPSKAGLGLGRKMVQYSIEKARDMGCKVIRLDTGGQNKPAVSLYKKLGFELAGTAAILLDNLISNKSQTFFEFKV